MDLAERVSKLKPSGEKASCFGTALYLAGLRETEVVVDVFEFADAFEALTKLDGPELGAIVAFAWADYPYEGQTFYNHAGLITSLTPLQIVNRRGYGGRVECAVDFASANMPTQPTSCQEIVLYARTSAMNGSD